MAPNPKIQKAFNAMKELGISQAKVKPVLKKLLITYEKNWALIEEDNFRALADAIFEEQEAEEFHEKKGKRKTVEPEEGLEDEEEATIEPVRPLTLKRIRRNGEGGSSLSPSGNSGSVLDVTLKKPKVENKGATASQAAQSSTTIHAAVQKNFPLETDITRALMIVPKDEPFTDDMPLAMVHPDSNFATQKTSSRRVQKTQNNSKPLQIASSIAETQKPGNEGQLLTNEQKSQDESAIEIASSPLGEVKISLTCSPALAGQNFHLPSLEELRKSMEEKCLRSYKILDPNFNVINLMNDMCSCFLDLATKSPSQALEKIPYLTPNLDVFKRSAVRKTVFGKTKETFHIESGILNGEVLERRVEKNPSEVDGAADDCGEKNNEDPKSCDSRALVVVPECQVTADEWRALNDVKDITRGGEVVEIPWVNIMNNEFPPAFYYVNQSLRFQNALVNFTLSGISDAQCCSVCFGDCLASPVPCACACQNGGFAYTSSGLLKEDFLEECISMTRHPKNQALQTCKVCPLEKAKNEELVEPCKGHLKRKIIKECWSRCGCNKQCGNRVVQRGVRKKLQVFFTPDGKGWGLRTLENLPKGTFICEYAGEILTITELYDRNTENNTNPIILDACWGSDEGIDDDRALCLDAMCYGNISRFINHRCLDANLIEVPVEVETPEHHYYHLGFFTTREINALEELNWDYGIDFDEPDYPIKMFQCLCGSKFCRNMKRANRAKHVVNG